MKVLVVGNGSMYARKGKYLVHKNTREFLIGLNGSVSYTEICISADHTEVADIANSELVGVGIHGFIKENVFSSLFGLLKYITVSDFVYVFFPGKYARLVAFISFLFAKPFGLYVRGQNINSGRFNGFLLDRASVIIAVSEGLLPSTQLEKLRICFPMLNLMNVPYVPKGGDQIKNFLYVGRIEKAKGVFEMLDFFCSHSRLYNSRLTLVGNGKDMETAKAEIRRMGINDRVVFHGSTNDSEELKDLYLKSEAFLLFSHSEGFPRVLYEATFHSTLVITTLVGGINSVFEDGKNCVVVDDNLLQKLSSLKKEGREQLILKAREDVAKRLSKYNLRHEELLNEYLNEFTI